MTRTKIVKVFTFSAALILIGGCAAVGSTFAPRKPALQADIRTSAMAVPDHDGIRHGVKNGILQLDAGDYESALKYFQSGLRLNPRDGHLHFLQALAYHLQSLSGDTAKQDLAEAGYQLALKYDPANFWAAYMLGQIYFSQQRYTDAENHFSYGLLFAPKNQTLLRAVSVASYYTRNVKVGHWAARRAYQVSPDNPSTLRALLFNRAAIGNIAGANQTLNEYQASVQRVGSREFGRDWQKATVNTLAERISDWDQFHQSRRKYAQADGRRVFGTDAQAEGTPLDLGSAPGEASRAPH